MSATITLARAQSELAAWLDASTKLAAGQTVSLNGRSLTRADAGHVQSMINYWSRMEASLLSRQQSSRDRSRMDPGLAKFPS